MDKHSKKEIRCRDVLTFQAERKEIDFPFLLDCEYDRRCIFDFARNIDLLYLEQRELNNNQTCLAYSSDIRNEFKTGFYKEDLVWYVLGLYRLFGSRFMDELLTHDKQTFWQMAQVEKEKFLSKK